MKLPKIPLVASSISMISFIPTAYYFAIHLQMEIVGLAWAKILQEITYTLV
jgi:Na+-driven multidrug efflux pump